MKKGNHVHSMEHLHRGNSKFCFQMKRVEGKEERYIVGISIDRKHEEFMKASSYFSSCLVEGIIITPSNTLSSLYRFNEFPPLPLSPRVTFHVRNARKFLLGNRWSWMYRAEEVRTGDAFCWKYSLCLGWIRSWMIDVVSCISRMIIIIMENEGTRAC